MTWREFLTHYADERAVEEDAAREVGLGDGREASAADLGLKE